MSDTPQRRCRNAKGIKNPKGISSVSRVVGKSLEMERFSMCEQGGMGLSRRKRAGVDFGIY
jgi:hypothetical protein